MLKLLIVAALLANAVVILLIADVASFVLLLSQFSANAQCSVTITGKKELNSPLRAKTGDCHVEMLMWQLNGETIYTAEQNQFKRHGYVVAGGNSYGSAPMPTG